MSQPNDDELDGCELDFTENPTPDENVDGVVLFADVDSSDPEAVEVRKQELRELFDA